MSKKNLRPSWAPFTISSSCLILADKHQFFWINLHPYHQARTQANNDEQLDWNNKRPYHQRGESSRNQFVRLEWEWSAGSMEASPIHVPLDPFGSQGHYLSPGNRQRGDYLDPSKFHRPSKVTNINGKSCGPADERLLDDEEILIDDLEAFALLRRALNN